MIVKKVENKITVCRKCMGNVTDIKTHNCKISLAQRGKKINPVTGSIEDMTDREISDFKKSGVKEPEEQKSNSKNLDKFLKDCDSIGSSIKSVKNEKELAAIEERLLKSIEKFEKTNPEKLPDDVEILKSAINDLRDTFKNK